MTGRVRLAVAQFKETVSRERDLERSRSALTDMTVKLNEEERISYIRETTRWQREYDERQGQQRA
jgi:hypothetical protein